MYLEYFGFSRFPFTIAPDPDFLFPSKGHQEALAHLQYAFTGHGGLICLTGEVGTGKTTLCRRFLSSAPARVRTAYLFNPQLTAAELLLSLCDELGFECPPQSSLRDLYRYLNEGLLEAYAAGDKVVCVIDEAQAMPAELLEQVRLLTNLETNREKLLTLILVGQPELRDLLQRHDLRQLNQRITARYHLDHLSLNETGAYLRHRASLAGAGQSLFSAAAVRRIWRASQGVPRMINTLADRALLGAYARERKTVDAGLVRGAEKEVFGSPANKRRRTVRLAPWLTAAVLAGIVFAGVLAGGWQRLPDSLVSLLGEEKISPVALLSEHGNGTGWRDCAQAAAAGQDCLWLDWPLSRLQATGQPFVKQIRDAEGQLHWVRSSESGVYAGQALMLWQAPEGYDGSLIRPGDKHAVVRWVRTKLDANWADSWQVIGPNGQPQAMDTTLYDPLLALKVAEFQQQQGLTPDRILGPLTLLYLARNGAAEVN